MKTLRSVLAVLLLLVSAGTAVGSAAAPAAAATTVPVQVDPQEVANAEVVISYIAGAAFVVAAFFKFHQHKENPQQATITFPTPIPIPDTQDLENALIVISYIAGAALVVEAIFKFKAHKDNPQQITVTFPTPIPIDGSLPGPRTPTTSPPASSGCCIDQSTRPVSMSAAACSNHPAAVNKSSAAWRSSRGSGPNSR